MKSDESIEQERVALELLIGPTRAGWYAEACRFEYNDPPDVLLWACRYREMAMEAGRLEEEMTRLRAVLEPFAALMCRLEAEAVEAESVGHEYPLHDDTPQAVPVGDIRRAAEAYEGRVAT